MGVQVNLTPEQVNRLCALLELFEHELQTTIKRAGMCTENRIKDVREMLVVLGRRAA